MEYTTIKISKETLELLRKLKIHPRQSFEEVIREKCCDMEETRE